MKFGIRVPCDCRGCGKASLPRPTLDIHRDQIEIFAENVLPLFKQS